MTAMGDTTIDKDFIGMLYGAFGTGKTIAAMKLAQELTSGSGILYLDSADGWVSLEPFPELKQDTTYYPLSSATDLAAIADALAKRAPGFEFFDVLVVDELSSVAGEVLEDANRSRTGVKRGDILEETIGEDDGVATQIVTSLVRTLKKTRNLHIIFVAHDREKVVNKVTVHSPQFSPLLNSEIQKLMHVTGYMSSKVTERKGKPTYERTIQSWPTAFVAAKNRLGEMPFKTDVDTWVNVIADWALGGDPLQEPNETPELSEDDLVNVPEDDVQDMDVEDEDENGLIAVEE
jgi:hypothetical protein